MFAQCRGKGSEVGQALGNVVSGRKMGLAGLGVSGEEWGWHMSLKFRDFRWNFHYDFSVPFGPLHQSGSEADLPKEG